MKKLLAVCLVVMVSLHGWAAIQTAGSLLVDVSAVSAGGVGEGGHVTLWENKGALPGDFVAPGTGPTYQVLDGVPALYFDGSGWSPLVGPGTPVELTGANGWSMEMWVFVPSLRNNEQVFLAWTLREGVQPPHDRMLEFRYYNNSGIAIEHYGGNNLPWGMGVPPAGVWHHFVFTRDVASSIERIYVDGRLVTTALRPHTDIAPGGDIVVGATWNGAKTGFWGSFDGYVGAVRIHSGTLTAEQAVLNYMAERSAYGVAVDPESIWVGASGVTLPWETAGHWLGGVKPGLEGSAVTFENGNVAALATDAGMLTQFSPSHGGLVMSGGARLAVEPDRRVYMGHGPGHAFGLDLQAGYFDVLGTTEGWLFVGVDGGSAEVTVGGGGSRAEISANRDIQVGAGGYGTVDIGANGGIYAASAVANGWVYIGVNSGGTGIVSVADGGEIAFRGTGQNNVMLGTSGGYGELRIGNGGSVRPTGDLFFTPGGASENAFAAVWLEAGGLIEARGIYGQNELGTRLMYLDGGTIRNRQDGGFMHGLTATYMQEGGVTFDILSGTWADVAQPLLHDPTLAAVGDGLVKRGEGLLILSGTNTFEGDITIEEGNLWLNMNSITDWPGTIRMNSPDVGVGLEAGGEVEALLAKLPHNSVGQIMLFPENAGDTFDFSKHEGLTLGVAHRHVTFTGTYIPYSSTQPYTFTLDNNAVLYFNDAISGGRKVEFMGRGSGSLHLGGNNSYTGGTVIDGGRLVMAHADALGSSGSITIRNGGVLRLEAEGISPVLVSRITPDSEGFIILGGAYADFPIDLTGRPGITVGTDQNTLNYNSTLTPEGSTYRVGGGGVGFRWNSNQGLVLNNLQDNGPNARKVVIQGEGLVRLAAGNSYSGGTVITNNGALFLREDSGLGAVPPSPDPSNVYIDNGAVRSADVWFEVNANRGWEIGPGGAEFHPWGGSRMTLMGNLIGTGNLSLTDGGTVAVGGVANTWQGTVDIHRNATFQIGAGGNLSWDKQNTFTGPEGWVAVDIGEALGTCLMSDIFEQPFGTGGASLGLRKRGDGTLLVDADQQYRRETVIEAGTLRVGSQGAIPGAPSWGNTVVDGVLDLNGYTVNLGSISGWGAIVDMAGGVQTLGVGANNNSATFNGSIEPDITLVKVGTGNQVLNTFDVNNVEVQSGTLTTLNPTAPSGTVTLASGATLAAAGNTSIGIGERGGLSAYYYDLPFTPEPEDFDSLEKIEAFIAHTPASLITSSASAGATLDFDYTARPGNGGRCRFAPPYHEEPRDRFALCLTGRFLAETAGEYTFGTRSDDGSFVIIDGSLVVSNNYTQGWEGSLRMWTVTLEAGEHDIMVFFYEGTHGHGLSVYMVPPGEAFDPEDPPALPQSLLTATALPSQWQALDTQGANISLYNNGAVNLNVDVNATVSGGTFTGAPGTMLIKSGGGRQTLEPQMLSMQGVIVTLGGELAFGTAGTLASLDIGAGSTVSTSAKQPGMTSAVGMTGLIGKYYDINPPNPFNAFNELATFETYLASHTPTLMASTLLVGERLQFGHGGQLFPPPYNQGRENFMVLWKGRILLPEDDEYIFYTASDDGSMLFINGEAIVRNNYFQGVTERSGTKELTAGWHDIAIAFFQGGGGYGMMARIEGGGLPYQEIPNSMLSPAPTDMSDGAWLGAGLTMAGTLTGLGTLALDGENTAANLNITEDCTFGGGAAGAASTVLFKTGATTLTLTGDNSAFHGKWCVLQGELIGADGAVLGAEDSEVNIADGAVLSLDGDVFIPGKITGGGTLRFVGNGTATIGDLSEFTGAIEVLSPGQSLALLGSGATLDAVRLAGIDNVMLLDGATLYVFDPLDMPQTLITSNATLVLAVTDSNKNAWNLDRLTVMAGTKQQVTVCTFGLYGKYYDLSHLGTGEDMAEEVQTAFWNVETAEAYLAQQQFAMAVPSWYYGDSLTCEDWKHPHPYNGSQYANFAVIWRGKVRITEPGRYSFGTRSDDNSMLFINGKVIVSSNMPQAPTTRSGAVELAQGVHDIDILFCQQGGGHYMDVLIQRPGDEDLIPMPNEMLVAALGDTALYESVPAYTLTASTVAVENAGVGTVEMLMNGTLAFGGLWIDTGAVLEVIGAARVAGPTLEVTVPEELPKGSPVLIADFTQTHTGLGMAPGVRLLPAEGSKDTKTIYRNQRLYLSRTQGTVMILR